MSNNMENNTETTTTTTFDRNDAMSKCMIETMELLLNSKSVDILPYSHNLVGIRLSVVIEKARQIWDEEQVEKYMLCIYQLGKLVKKGWYLPDGTSHTKGNEYCNCKKWEKTGEEYKDEAFYPSLHFYNYNIHFLLYTYEEEWLDDEDDDEDDWALECFYCKDMVNCKYFYTNNQLERINKKTGSYKICCSDCVNDN